jgi:coenzyme F420-reducing hydrogenase delta subunit/Pyruvate/2-oxoacid:ferredoxin oxidoreductase delta subunit
MALGSAVLREFGLSKDTLRVVKYSRKVTYDTSKCVGCDKCVFVCPYEAIEAEPLATPKIIMEKCMGCGACALVCPHNAIQVEGYEFDNILKRYGEAARMLKKNGQFPVVLVFVCQWSEYSAIDDPESALRETKGVVMLEIPCFKSLDPVHVVNALNNGFDGVLAAVCPPEDCRLEKGKETAERNVAVAKDTLRKMKLLDRFEVVNVSPRNREEFKARLSQFVEKIASMPRLGEETAQVCTKS